MHSPSRRELLGLGLGWLPFRWHRRSVTLDGMRFRVIRHGRASRHYLLIHGNEETARQVLEEYLQDHDGAAWLAAGHTRYIAVEEGKLDPNRMFSRAGAEKNLRSLNPGWDQEHVNSVLDRLDRHRDQLLNTLFPAPGELLFALHNNSKGYNVRDEIALSDRVSIKKPEEPHEFFLCTEPDDFTVLEQSPYNAVLQRYRQTREDDGSLSRLAAARGVRYLNLEVAVGKTAKQIEMLTWADSRLKHWAG